MKTVEYEELAILGYLPTNKNIMIFVNTDDICETPHFHIREFEGNIHNIVWESALYFDKAEYAFHGFATDKIPTDVLNELNIFLNKINMQLIESGEFTYWQDVLNDWNLNNFTYINVNIIKPNYNEIERNWILW